MLYANRLILENIIDRKSENFKNMGNKIFYPV